MFYFFIFFVFIFGLIMGSFLNCFIWRVYKKESLWNRSYCPKCKKKIAWYDNIPVISFLALRGRCRACQRKISIQYPIIEFFMGVLFVVAFCLHWFDAGLVFGGLLKPYYETFILLLVRDWFIIFVCLGILIYDWRWFLIPDVIILPAIALAFTLNMIIGESFMDMLWPAIIGGSFFLVQFLVSSGRWIGGGDVRMGFFMGVALARLDHLVLAILLAYWIGSMIGIFLIMKKGKTWDAQVPLGIFLSIGTILTLFFGQVIIDWYFGLF